MRLPRIILRPAAALAGRHAWRQRRAFLAAQGRAREVQGRLLRELLEAHRDTAFGREHDFARIRTRDDFVRAVPIRSYEALRPYVDRVLAGETTALLPPGEPVLMFARTSGTTGEPKHVPVTRRFLADARRGWNVFGVSVLRDHPDGWLRPILQITSPMDEARSPTGLPCGAISGLLAATQKRIVRRMYVVPPAVTAIRDPDARCYTLLRCAVERDVGLITTANPSSTIRLIETGRQHLDRLLRDLTDGTLRPPGEGVSAERLGLRLRANRALAGRIAAAVRRDGELLPRHFWNVAFLTNWTGGTLKLYLPRLRRLFGGVPIRDIGLLASEGRLSLPLEDETAAGAAEITSNVLEFIPADDYGRADPPALPVEQVEVGQEYFVVLSNWAGLWRYSLDDRVRVTGRVGEGAVLEFLARGLHTANITGEKITEDQVVEAVRRALGAEDGRLVRFVMQGRFAETPYYELRIDEVEGLQADGLAERVDAELSRLNVEYASKRHSGRLGPVRPVVLPAGSLGRQEAESIRRRGGRSEQYKHRYLRTDVRTEPRRRATAPRGG